MNTTYLLFENKSSDIVSIAELTDEGLEYIYNNTDHQDRPERWEDLVENSYDSYGNSYWPHDVWTYNVITEDELFLEIL